MGLAGFNKGGDSSANPDRDRHDKRWTEEECGRIQDALLEGEERLRTVLDESSAAIFLKDLQGRYLMVNRPYEIAQRAAREWVVGKTDHDLLPKEVADEFRANDRRVLEIGAPLELDEVLLSEEGERPSPTIKFPLYDADGNLYAVCGISANVIEQMKAERDTALEIEASYRALVEDLPELVSRFSPDLTLTYVNEAYCRYYDKSREELIGHSIMLLVPEEDREGLKEHLASLSRESPVGAFENRTIRSDGEVRWQQWTNRAVYDEEGRFVGYQTVGRDFDARKLAEEALKESEERLQSLTDAALEGITITEDEKVLDANRAFCEMFGYELSEVRGMSAPEFHPPEYRDEVQRKVLAGYGERYESIGLKKDGTTFDIEIRGRTASYENRMVRVTTLRDITERKRAEEALKESEERFRSMIQNASDIITIIDADGVVRYDSPAIERVLGYQPGERVGKKGFDYIHPEDLEVMRRTFAEVLDAPGVGLPVEYRLRHKDGSWRYMETIRTNLLDDPAVRGIVVNSRDITERQGAEEKLRESEEFHRAVIEQSVEAIYLFDPETKRVLESNNALEELLGYTSEELLGMTLYDFIAHDRDDIDLTVQRHILEKQRFVGERRYRQKDGSVIEVEASATVNPYFGRDVVCVVVRDVTERREAEEALKESEERFRSAFENAPIGVALVGLDTRYLRVNQALCEMLGYPEEELLGKASPELIHPDDREISAEHVRQALEEGLGSYTLERRYVRASGSVAWNLTSVSLIQDSEGNPDHFVCLHQDITERKQAEEALRKSRARFRAVFDRAAIGMALVDSEGLIVESNPALQEMFGYSEEELRGMHFADVTHPDDVASDTKQFEKLMAGELDHFRLEKRYIRKDGSLVWGHLISSSIRDDENRPKFMIGMVENVTERKQAEEALKESEERFRGAFEDAPIGVALVGLDGRRFRVNHALCEMLGYSEEELLGKVYTENIHPEDREISADRLQRMLEKGEGNYTLERRYIHADGRTVWNLSSVSLIQDSEGNPSHLVCLHQDITERKALEDHLEHQAFHDSLTGLPNRALFLDRLEHALARASRENGSVAVVFVDLDDFKVVNDSLGHDAGNTLLVKVAERLKDSVRSGDTVGRVFGDEFAVLLEAPAGIEEARRVADRIAERLQEASDVYGQEVYVTPSIGISLGESIEDEPKDLLRNADLAMYEAKSRGKDQHQVYSPSMNTRAVERMDLENDLRRAIEREEFEVYYQPIVDLKTGEIGGVEALVRWRHPERGLVAFSEFVHLAEETGLIRPIGYRVLEEACRQAKEWRERHSPSGAPLMSVNLSASQFSRQPDLIPKVLSETGLDPSALHLEITERVVMDDAEFALGKLNKLKGQGVSFAIDDYGMGYSCLYYLKRMPLDSLKIDGSFIAGLGEDPGDEAIVSGTIGLAHALGLKVIAEGVETEGQLAKLKELGCDLAQGFYLYEPLTSREISDLLAGEDRP